MISRLKRAERKREREREHEERLERVRSGSRRWAQTTATSPDAPLSSRWRDLAARSRHRAHAREIVLPRSYCEIVPPPSRSNCFRLNLDAAWSLPLLDRSRRPWPVTNLSLSLNFWSLSLPPSLSLTELWSLTNGVVLIFVFLSLYIEIFYYKICLVAEKMGEKMWESSRKIEFLECNQTHENIF